MGEAKALEMNITGDAILAEDAFEYGLVNQVVADHELIDHAVRGRASWASRRRSRSSKIKEISAAGDLDEGIEAEKQGFAEVFQTEDAREGIGAFLGKRTPKWKGK